MLHAGGGYVALTLGVGLGADAESVTLLCHLAFARWLSLNMQAAAYVVSGVEFATPSLPLFRRHCLQASPGMPARFRPVQPEAALRPSACRVSSSDAT